MCIYVTRKRTKNSYKPSHLEMEIKLKDWILQERALGVCISGLVIRVKAFEIERAICNEMNKPCLFKPSNGRGTLMGSRAQS
jgi:hypothetical protein